jgi:predicted glycoside hydrolase/deacetylase ChbG (UPF0249 family)
LEVFPNEQRRSFWQPGFFDHLLRNNEVMCENGTVCAKILCAQAW